MKHFYKNINGYMYSANTIMFKKVLDTLPQNSTWVELGSWTGRSTAYCSVELLNRGLLGKFYSIDTWEGSIEHVDLDIIKQKSLEDVFKSNVSPILDKITMMKSFSWNAADSFENNSVDFCYVDAAHDYESVTKDLEAWWPKIKEGSFFGGDDYTEDWQGVIDAVNDFFKSKNVKVESIGRCWLVKKITPTIEMN
jgi:hypothetical protein